MVGSYELSMPRLSITVTKQNAVWLGEMSEKTGKSVSMLIREALHYYQSSFERGTITVGPLEKLPDSE